MKQLFRPLAALCGAALMFQGAAAAVSAAETDLTPESVCPDFVPLGTDTFTVRPETAFAFEVQIIQHSPERAHLVLYENSFTGAEAEQYIFRLEPGDYTVWLSAPAVQGSSRRYAWSTDITIDNPDYNTDPETPYSRTDYIVSLDQREISGDVSADPERTEPETAYADDVKNVTSRMLLSFYAKIRGDYDGSGEVDLTDAQLTLAEYTAALTGVTAEKPADKEQKTVCDIDNDGELTLADAQQILLYYTAQISGLNPQWPQ